MTQPATRPLKSGLTVEQLREEVLDGIPVYNGAKGIAERLIQRALASAEDKVEKDTDILLSPRTVHCIQDQSDPVFEEGQDDDFRIVKPPLDKPANWFAGNRFGALRLPIGPARRLHSLTLVPFGVNARRLPVPVPPDPRSPVRLERNTVRFVPNVIGGLMAINSVVGAHALNDKLTIPGGVEVVYEAGLSARQLAHDGQTLITMVVLAAQIEVLTEVQARLGGGVQKEKLVQDGMGNEVELAKREGGGPLGGEIAAARRLYEWHLRSVRAGKLDLIVVG